MIDENNFFSYYTQDVSDKANGWAKKLEHKQKELTVTMYQKKDSQGKGIITKSCFWYNGITMKTTLDFFNNLDKHNKDPNVKEMNIVSRHPNGDLHIFYQRFKLPLMSERDCLIETNTMDLEGEYAGKKLWIMKDC